MIEWVIIPQFIFNCLTVYLLIRLNNRVFVLENEKKERLQYIVDKNTDPELIDAELERSARRREAFDSKMPYPPREDSGPAAVVKQPRMTPWSKSASKFKGTPIYKGEPKPPRYLPNQPKKDG